MPGKTKQSNEALEAKVDAQETNVVPDDTVSLALATPHLATRRGEVIGGKQEVKKHVAAIHTSGELGLVERKLVNILLLNAYDNLATVRQHRLPTKWLMAMLGWAEGDDTVHLKKALLRIVTTPVEFNLMEDAAAQPGKKTQRWTATALLASADLVNGYCEYEYATRLAEELGDPDVYAIINVGIQRQFRSGYALTLYENCVRYRRIGSTGWMSLAIFRKLMGASTPTYDDFRRLSDLVIKKAVKEVNEVSDIKLTAEYERVGRKVARIRFVVEEKEQATIFNQNENVIEEVKQGDTFKRLRSHGIGEKLAIAWILTDEQRAVAALDITEQKARGGQIKKTGGYVRKLIEDTTIDLSTSTFDKQLEEEANAKRAAEAAQAAAREKAEAEKLARGDKLRDLVKSLSDAEMKEFAATYVAGEGAGRATSYDPVTGTFKIATERVPFMTWVRKQLTVKHGMPTECNLPCAA